MSDDDGFVLNIAKSSSLPKSTSTPKVRPRSKVERKKLKKKERKAKKVEKQESKKEEREKKSVSRRTKPSPSSSAADNSAVNFGSKPWERKPDPSRVKIVVPVKIVGETTNKTAAKVRAQQGTKANISDSKTFTAEFFEDESLQLNGKLVENLKTLFSASRMTLIQRGAVPAILRGADVMMKAKTGTGKTLAYLTPVVEWLVTRKERLTRADGSFALIVVPTRELGLQVHEVLSNLLRPFHWLVPGLLIGGEKKKSEKARIRKGLSVLVGTPGRLSDHVRTTECFNVKSMQFLIFDEADRLMDMGFEQDINCICDFVREKRDKSCPTRMQTVLVSATLQQKVRQFAHSLLSSPVYVTDSSSGAMMTETGEEGKEEEAGEGEDEENKKFELPSRLRQYWMSIPCKRRLLSLCSFLRQRSIPSTRACKMIVFVSSIAEVKFLHYLLPRAVLPDEWRGDEGDIANKEGDSDEEEEEEDGGLKALLSIPIYGLHGDMTQAERTKSFYGFTASSRAILVCTDVAARGLDFPKIEWIVQFDPPTELEEYVHRCGRTARMTTEGDALLFLMPHEEKYVSLLGKHGLSLSPIPTRTLLSVVKKKCEKGENDEKFLSLQRSLEDIVATDPLAAELARDAFTSFTRAYATHNKGTKAIFHPKALHLGHVAASFALREQPKKIKVTQYHQHQSREIENKRKQELKEIERKPWKRRKIAGFNADLNVGISGV